MIWLKCSNKLLLLISQLFKGSKEQRSYVCPYFYKVYVQTCAKFRLICNAQVLLKIIYMFRIMLEDLLGQHKPNFVQTLDSSYLWHGAVYEYLYDRAGLTPSTGPVHRQQACVARVCLSVCVCGARVSRSGSIPSAIYPP